MCTSIYCVLYGMVHYLHDRNLCIKLKKNLSRAMSFLVNIIHWCSQVITPSDKKPQYQDLLIKVLQNPIMTFYVTLDLWGILSTRLITFIRHLSRGYEKEKRWRADCFSWSCRYNCTCCSACAVTNRSWKHRYRLVETTFFLIIPSKLCKTIIQYMYWDCIKHWK